MTLSMSRKSNRGDRQRRNRRRLSLEPLERRALLAAFMPANVELLIAHITTANTNGESDVVDL